MLHKITLYKRPHNRQLGLRSRISRITDCNFIVRMLYRNTNGLLYILALRFVLFLSTTAVRQFVTKEYVMLCYVMLWDIFSDRDTCRDTGVMTRDEPRHSELSWDETKHDMHECVQTHYCHSQHDKLQLCCVLFFSRPRSEDWPHRGRTFSIYLCPLSSWLTLPRWVLSTSWCFPPTSCEVFLACVQLYFLKIRPFIERHLLLLLLLNEEIKVA